MPVADFGCLEIILIIGTVLRLKETLSREWCGSLPDQFVWDLSWTKWRVGRFFSDPLEFSCHNHSTSASDSFIHLSPKT